MIEKIKGYIEAEDIESLYGVYAQEGLLDEAERQELLAVLVDMATDRLHEKMVSQEHFMFDNKSEQFMLRVLYEKALSEFEAGHSYEAQEAFAMLSVASDSPFFSEAVKKHLLALMVSVDFDTFITQWVSDEAPKHFFLSRFTKEVDKRLKKGADAVAQATQKYAKLFR